LFNPLWRYLLNSSRRLLAPGGDTCIICNGIYSDVSGGLPLCRKCCGHIPWIKPSDIVCQVCGRYEECPDCSRRSGTWFESNHSVVRYDHVMKDWLGRFKYRGNERLQLLFAGMFVSLFHRFLADQQWRSRDVTLLTYVPLSRERLEERGFNQAELFTRALSSAFRVPVIPLLDRVRHTGKQSYKTRGERLHDLRGVFVANSSGVDQLFNGNRKEHMNIILVDDVYTTGSTVNECARIIREVVPCSRVFSLTWAR
jgi:competence protein ComFC